VFVIAVPLIIYGSLQYLPIIFSKLTDPPKPTVAPAVVPAETNAVPSVSPVSSTPRADRALQTLRDAHSDVATWQQLTNMVWVINTTMIGNQIEVVLTDGTKIRPPDLVQITSRGVLCSDGRWIANAPPWLVRQLQQPESRPVQQQEVRTMAETATPEAMQGGQRVRRAIVNYPDGSKHYGPPVN